MTPENDRNVDSQTSVRCKLCSESSLSLSVPNPDQHARFDGKAFDLEENLVIKGRFEGAVQQQKEEGSALIMTLQDLIH